MINVLKVLGARILLNLQSGGSLGFLITTSTHTK